MKTPEYGTKAGFTLTEIMIVVFIIAMLVAVALPNFMRAKRDVERVTCLSNLKAIDEAIDRYASSLELGGAEPVVFEGLMPRYLKSRPVCPSRGTYSVTIVSANPVCSMEEILGHKLP